MLSLQPSTIFLPPPCHPSFFPTNHLLTPTAFFVLFVSLWLWQEPSVRLWDWTIHWSLVDTSVITKLNPVTPYHPQSISGLPLAIMGKNLRASPLSMTDCWEGLSYAGPIQIIAIAVSSDCICCIMYKGWHLTAFLPVFWLLHPFHKFPEL